ncbi:hypothetical protein MSG28_008213 [Choristoneura fumiferana]|uniref:Uncharacterized protein n=1 Tax=Choristoneura fumiferana TaxID=7141 RepID=A0ACC0JAI0_CHOFU|nr:hypothetical protein MSG28_008213 [Choristoneura fumiferana]
MCGITFEIYHELFGEGKHREETCTNLRSNSMVRVKFPIRTGPARELRPKPSCHPEFKLSIRGNRILYYKGYKYHKEREYNRRTRWQCGTHRKSIKCTGSVITIEDENRNLNSHRKERERCSIKAIVFFGETCKGGRYIYYRGYKYHKEKQSGLKTRWYCGTHRRLGCHGAISTIEDDIIKFQFLLTKAGGRMLFYQGHKYHRQSHNQYKTRWQCVHNRPFRCLAVVHTYDDEFNSCAPRPEDASSSTRDTGIIARATISTRLGGSAGTIALLDVQPSYTRMTTKSSKLMGLIIMINMSKGSHIEGGGSNELLFLPSTRGSRILFFAGYKFHRHYATGVKARWHCATRRKHGCLASLITVEDKINIKANCRIMHNHEPEEYPELGDYLKRPEDVDVK